ncbi:MAG: 4-(cytidine 5'-diphospho)-2-C-methyl-D-erythritol kinase [Rhodobacteraceae bacterium]|nr:4-(cytidine 5'-diphospho)-2-C-methyl-D-erythritol kinase [Paracoccaceae bacterium]
MTTVDIFAPAKLNLTLHVTGRRADGYHLLDSLVAFADIGDQITVAPCPVLSLTIGGPQAVYLSTGHSNLVLRAANFLGPQRSAAIHLDKQLPVAAGIGGGSADAAATLRALSMLWDVDLPLPEATVDLGADVPVCMIGQTLRMQGVGDQITRLPDLPDMEVVLVNPRIAVSTPDIFRGLAEKSNAPMDQDLPNWNSLDAFTEWLGHQRNDLQALAMEQQPVIADVLAANADKVEEYKCGKDKLFGFFVGQTMKAMDGKANPRVVNELLHKALG